ncbi:MAG: hypothetical protein DWQ01_15530 [Planctomycetota bacterium]|nr:MAG: hypothetical protein DWQ01_15530 [Planctomycetota bacterium]
MSSLGKTFIVVNLVLSALFVGASASLIGTSQEYRKKFEDEQQAKTELEATLNTEKADLQAEVGRLSDDLVRKDGEITSLKADNATRLQELTDARRQNDDQNGRLESLSQKINSLEQVFRTEQSRNESLNNTVQQLREERDNALDERDAAFAAQSEAEDGQNQAEGQVRELEAQLNRVQDNLDQKEALLAMAAREYSIDFGKLSQPQPDMDGLVLSSSYADGTPIVIINRGKSDGVRVGFTFDVFNGGLYKGQIRVEHVNENSAAARVTLEGEGQIVQGDLISTRV